MTLGKIWMVLSRWRWVLIPGIVLALGGSYALFSVTLPSQTVSSSYLFLSPVKDVKGVAGNPFLQLGSGVSQVVDVLSVSLSDDTTSRPLIKGHPKLKYTAGRDTSVGAPLMVISVEDTSSSNAKRTLATLGDLLQARLSTLQENAAAPRSQWITITQLTDEVKPKVGYDIPIRNGVLVFIGAIIFLLVAILISERIRLRWRARKERRSIRISGAVQEGAEFPPDGQEDVGEVDGSMVASADAEDLTTEAGTPAATELKPAKDVSTRNDGAPELSRANGSK